MTPDEPTVPPADDLRGDIMKAFEASSAEDGGEAVEPPQQPEAREPAPTAMPERARDAQGRFVATQSAPELSPGAQADAAVVAAQQRPQAGGEPQAGPSVVAGPPPGWSVAGKAAYAGLPDAVKADIAKREGEMSQGLAKLAEYKNLDPYVEMARNARTTLPEALARYTKAEQTLETDPISGMLWLAQSYKVDPAHLMYGLCQLYNIHPLELVKAIGGDMPNQTGEELPPSYQSDPRTSQQLQAMNQRLAFMEQDYESKENQAINGQIAAFAQDPSNKWFENVRHIMAHIIRTAPEDQNLTLKQVYDQACWTHPEVREQLINERHPGNQNSSVRGPHRLPPPSGSLPSGSPVAGGTLTQNEPAPTLREEIRRAFEEHRN